MDVTSTMDDTFEDTWEIYQNTAPPSDSLENVQQLLGYPNSLGGSLGSLAGSQGDEVISCQDSLESPGFEGNNQVVRYRDSPGSQGREVVRYQDSLDSPGSHGHNQVVRYQEDSLSQGSRGSQLVRYQQVIMAAMSYGVY